MGKSVEALKWRAAKLRTGRAHTSRCSITCQGQLLRLRGADQPGGERLTCSTPRTLGVTPWEKKVVPDVEKAIINSDLGPESR